MPKSKQLTLNATQVRGRPITWTQVSLEAIEGVIDLNTRNRNAANLLLTLIQHMRPGSGGVVVTSRQTMTELLNTSMPTIERALRLLIEEGWVQRVKIGGAHALAVNYRVAWTGPRDEIQHAVFGATVIASSSEQDAIAMDPPPMREIPITADDEIPLITGAGNKPPSQPQLEGVPPLVGTWSNSAAHWTSTTIHWKQQYRA